MAITPRTVLSDPINLLVFACGLLALGGLAGVFVGASDREQSPCLAQVPAGGDGSLDAGPRISSAGAPGDAQSAGVRQAGAGPEVDVLLDYTCRLEQPSPQWTAGEWLRHLGCMEARGEETGALLAEINEAIVQVGLTPELALEKAKILEEGGRFDERISFLDAAVTRLGVSEGKVVHELTRALTWRGETADIERIRHLQLLSRMLLSDSCEVLQTDVWVRYTLADRVAEEDSPAAWKGVERAIDTYLANDCHQRSERGHLERRDVLAEMVGVGVVAEAVNGHSTLIRTAVDSSQNLGEPTALCREAVPAKVGLRAECAKRVGDEIFLAR